MTFRKPGHSPSQHPLANSSAPLALVLNRGGRIRLVELNPIAAAAAGICAAVALAGLIAMGCYWTFRDDLMARYVRRQAEMQYAYEDRIAALRAQVDRLASRGLLNQEGMEARIDDLLARQAKLESRQGIVSTIADMAGVAQPAVPAPPKSVPSLFSSPKLPAGASAFAPAELRRSGKPVPDDGDAARPPGEAPSPPAPRPVGPTASLSHTVEQVDASLHGIERNQMAVLAAAENRTQERIGRLRDVIDAVGLTPGRFQATARTAALKSAVGGPFIPLPPGSPFDGQVGRIHGMLDEALALRRVVDDLPLKRPLAEAYGITSPFGARVDPFLGTHALHSGTDFRAPTGTQIRPTAPGKVIEAGWSGGYGNMVEVDHGHGITTRYAHLSAILTEVGETVTKDSVIGRVGTTGRSTGSHLHYEVRIDGDPVDPMRFIKPGQLFASR